MSFDFNEGFFVEIIGIICLHLKKLASLRLSGTDLSK